MCGAEALDTVRRLKKAGERPQWSFKPEDKRPFPFEAPFHPAEVAHEVFQAYTTFALWDVARRAHLGVDPDVYRASMGELFAPMSEIAARNPYAWFPVARTPDEVVEAAPDNRMVAYPYTKYLISVMDVDLSGALVIASHEAADRLGVPPDRRVYLRGWCYGTDATYVAEHDPTYGSPAMAAASTEAMTAAGVGIDDVAYIDLYSCFPSSVAFAIDALGLKADDEPRLHRHRRTAVLRRRGQRLLDAFDRHDGRAAADGTGRAGVVQRRRHAHDQARVRRVLGRTTVDRATAGSGEGPGHARRSSSHADRRHVLG